MNTKRILTLISFAAGIAGTHAAPAEQNWGQWRGPHADGTAPNGNPPTEWSETKNVKWKIAIPGEGNATPIVWDNLVFVQSAVPVAKKPEANLRPDFTPQFAGLQQPPPPPPGGADGQPPRRRPDGPGGPPGGGQGGPGGQGGGGGRRGGFGGGGPPTTPFQFTMTALDRATGKEAWKKILKEELPHEGHHGDGSFASASPITDGENVFAYYGSRGLYCLDLKGNVKWQKDLGKMRTANSFGEGSSPALSGNTIVVNWDHEGEDFIVAFDKTSGKELWKQPRQEATSWSTPLIVQHGGSAQVVVNATTKIRSYDLAGGKELWSVGPLTRNAIPSAVADKDTVYCMSGFMGSSLFAIKLGHIGDLAGTEAIAWTRKRDTPYVPSPLLYDGRLYFFKGNEATLTILNAKTGDALVEAERMEGIRGVYASPVGAANRVYLLGRDGGALVLKKGDKAEVLATNKLDDRFDASPAVVGNELFLRGKRNLYCIAPTDRADAK
jgi:outer membrane protein assembly factor BamB